MDTKITKDRIVKHLEYDWYKYLLILLGSIALWAMIFSAVNNVRSYEQITFFINAPFMNEEGQAEYRTKLFERLSEDGDEVIVEINFLQNAGTESMGELLQTRPLTSDFLVYETEILNGWYYSIGGGCEGDGGGCRAFTPELMEYLGITGDDESGYTVNGLPIEFNAPIPYTDSNDNPQLLDRKYGIKLNNLKNIKAFLPSFGSIYLAGDADAQSYITKSARHDELAAKANRTADEEAELLALITEIAELEPNALKRIETDYYLCLSADSDNFGTLTKGKAGNEQGKTAFGLFFEMFGEENDK